MNRGDIYWIDPVPTKGSEQSKSRPAVIIQNNKGNKYSSTTIVAYITSKNNHYQPTHVRCKHGVILLEQISTICKSRIRNKIGSLCDTEIIEMEKALKVSLGLIDNPLNEMLNTQALIVKDEIALLEKYAKDINVKLNALQNKSLSLQYALEALEEPKEPEVIEELKEPEVIEEPEMLEELENKIIVQNAIKNLNNTLAREVAEYMFKKQKEVSLSELVTNLSSKPSRSNVSNVMFRHLRPAGIAIPLGDGIYKIKEA